MTFSGDLAGDVGVAEQRLLSTLWLLRLLLLVLRLLKTGWRSIQFLGSLCRCPRNDRPSFGLLSLLFVRPL